MLTIASLWPMMPGRYRLTGVFFVAWAGISRICLGAHFPADVLAGFASAYLIVLVVRKAIESALPHRA